MPRNSNTQGATISGRMSDYDKLPKAARLALQQSDHNWSGEQLYRQYKRKHAQVRTAALCALFIVASDAKKHREDSADPANSIMPGQR
jgi:hypothetical protein